MKLVATNQELAKNSLGAVFFWMSTLVLIVATAVFATTGKSLLDVVAVGFIAVLSGVATYHFSLKLDKIIRYRF